MSATTLAPQPFDVLGPLPSGVTVLEASAGTGKTYTIAALATRYVAEGTPLDDLLLVTFTRMATGELRDRVRERLVSAHRALDRALAGDPPDPEVDGVAALLASGPEEDVRVRRERLRRALADFDAATITTTHGFCQEVLGSLGIAGDVEEDCAFVEDVSDLLGEVVDDLYVKRFRLETPSITRDQAGRIAREAVFNPGVAIVPAAAPEGSLAAMGVRLARAVVREVEARKRRLAVMTYDDLLTRLRDALRGDGAGAVAERLRGRHRVVLIDEFQDTDPVQWEIVERAFVHDDCTLVLIGDPKQAIYAFRGADVFAYLEAAATAGTLRTLETNWRSDQALLDAYAALFDDCRLGHQDIVVRRVAAAPPNAASRLLGAPDPTPLRVRVVDRTKTGRTAYGYAEKGPAMEHVARDLAADLATLLASGATLQEHGRARGICPGDVAVLVRTHRQAERVQRALDALRVPAVINGAGSVFGTEAATEWLRLLDALESPTSPARARTAALTSFVGWTAARVAGAGDDDWEDVHGRLHRWAHVLRSTGVAALVQTITREEGLAARCLSRDDGERHLTDLRHVGQLLHAAATSEQMGAPALTAWLRRRVAAARDESGDEERSRRLESDEQAVQVLTIHRSKGLEFPVVYLPYLWDPATPRHADDEPVVFHDPDNLEHRTLDVGLNGPDYHRHRRRRDEEERGEDLRLAYVALTRAKHQAVVWWAGGFDTRDSSLTRLLFARREDGTIGPSGPSKPADQEAWERFTALAERAPGRIGVAWAEPVDAAPLARGGEPAAALEAARLERALDRAWRRTSYSAMSADLEEAAVASEPETRLVADEPDATADVVAPPAEGVAPADGPLAAPSLLGAMPFGAHVGTFVHGVLEAADFAAGDLEGELAGHVRRLQRGRRSDLGDPAQVVAGLAAALRTPLDGDGWRLADVGRGDRLDELAFEVPLVGGDRAQGLLTLAAVGELLRGDPAVGTYAERLVDPDAQRPVRGYLTGSIDLVARTADGRFAVVDYKTNWLAAPGEALRVWHYRPQALAAEMQRHDYVLQALLYQVTLHRYLRWRLAGYDPERHLGGAHYLFVRGMTGPDTPAVDGARCGVFSWRPSGALVAALSDVLDRGAA